MENTRLPAAQSSSRLSLGVHPRESVSALGLGVQPSLNRARSSPHWHRSYAGHPAKRDREHSCERESTQTAPGLRGPRVPRQTAVGELLSTGAASHSDSNSTGAAGQPYGRECPVPGRDRLQSPAGVATASTITEARLLQWSFIDVVKRLGFGERSAVTALLLASSSTSMWAWPMALVAGAGHHQ